MPEVSPKYFSTKAMRNADDIGGGRNAFKYNLPQLKIKRAVKFQHRVKTVVRFRQPQVAFFDVNGFGPAFPPFFNRQWHPAQFGQQAAEKLKTAV